MLKQTARILGWVTVILLAVIILLAVTRSGEKGVLKIVMDVSLQVMHAAFLFTSIYYLYLTAKGKFRIFFWSILFALTAFIASFVLILFNVRFPMPFLLGFDGYVMILYLLVLGNKRLFGSTLKK